MTSQGFFAELLHRLRTTAGLTQEELAFAAGLSTRAISDLERGVNVTARRDTARLLADALGLAGDAREEFVAASRGRRPAEAVRSRGGAAAENVSLRASEHEGHSRQSATGTLSEGELDHADGRGVRLSRWHFPGGGPIALACQRLPPDRRPPSSDKGNPNYTRFSGMADLDTLIDVHGAANTYNPASHITIVSAQDLTYEEAGRHLVLIGGLAWSTASAWISRVLPMPVAVDDPCDHRAMAIRDPGGGEQVFSYVLNQDEVVEDVGVFASGANPWARHRLLTICGGITTRGVRGAARCFIDPAVRETNENYIAARFSDVPFYCIAMRVPIVNGEPLAPDLSRNENRLYEWTAPAPVTTTP
jgi:transcriptional regulator with XRE-family HTH domain